MLVQGLLKTSPDLPHDIELRMAPSKVYGDDQKSQVVSQAVARELATYGFNVEKQ